MSRWDFDRDDRRRRRAEHRAERRAERLAAHQERLAQWLDGPPRPQTPGSGPGPGYTRFYRDKLNGRVMGVCAGIADYTGIDAIWVRLAMIVLAFSTGPLVWMAYFGLGLFAPVKPPHLYADGAEARFWQGVRQSPARTAREVRARFREIDRRLAAVEAHYVSSNPRLADEIEKLR